MRNWSFRTVTLSAIVVLVAVMFSAISITAQATTGTIRGTIADANGAVVAGASVKIKNEGTGSEITTTTNSQGIFSSGSLIPGSYTVTVEQAGFKRFVQTGIAVKIGLVSGVDVAIEPGALDATVTVTSNQEEVLQTEQSQISGSIDSRRVQDLPSNGAGNGLDTLALLIPGVVANRVGGTNTNGTGLSVNGNRGRANNFQIDGADNNDLSLGGPIYLPAFGEGGPRIWDGHDKAFFFVGYQGTRNPGKFISRSTALAVLPSEFSRLSASFPGNNLIDTVVRYGPFAIGASNIFGPARVNSQVAGTTISAQLNLAPASGCPRAVAVGATPPTGCTGYTTPINPATGQPFLTGGPYDVLNFGTAAAPILIQAANYERTGDTTYNEDNVVFRFDVVATQKDNVTFRFYDQDTINTNACCTIAARWAGNVPATSRNLGGNWSHTFSNSLLNDFRASYNRIFVDFGGGCTGQPSCTPSGSDIGSAFANISFAGSNLGVTKTTSTLPTLGPATNIPQGRTVTVYQYAATLNCVRGKHSIRFVGASR